MKRKKEREGKGMTEYREGELMAKERVGVEEGER
jgi:hypothetical protein